MSSWFTGARRPADPWWEPDPGASESVEPESDPTRPTLTLSPAPAPATAPGADAPEHSPVPPYGRPGVTARGAFVLMVTPAAVGCVIGFLLSGVGTISPLAGWGLLLGALVAGLKVSPRLGWFPVFLPPLAMVTVIAVLGQTAMLGSRPSLIRELAIIVAGLTATAPAQLAGVAVVAGAIFWRRQRRVSPPAPIAATEAPSAARTSASPRSR